MPTMKRAVSLPSSTLRDRDRHRADAIERSPVALVEQAERDAEQQTEQQERDAEARHLLVEAVDRLRAAADGDLLDAERGAERRYGRDVERRQVEVDVRQVRRRDGLRSPRLDANVEMGRQLDRWQRRVERAHELGRRLGKLRRRRDVGRAARREALELREPRLEVGARLAQGVEVAARRRAEAFDARC